MMKQVVIVFALIGVFGSAAVFTADQQTLNELQPPNEVIEYASAEITDRLEGRRAYFATHPVELYEVVNEIMAPYFDVRYAGRLVLGNHWKTSTAEQRDRFIDAFYDFLLQSYADAVLKFKQDAVTIYAQEGDLPEKRAVVKTSMRMDDGSMVPVNYSLRKSKVGWRVYDVRIEGVSYIQNYRNQFNAEIAALGIDAVTERLLLEASQARGLIES